MSSYTLNSEKRLKLLLMKLMKYKTVWIIRKKCKEGEYHIGTHSTPTDEEKEPWKGKDNPIVSNSSSNSYLFMGITLWLLLWQLWHAGEHIFLHLPLSDWLVVTKLGETFLSNIYPLLFLVVHDSWWIISPSQDAVIIHSFEFRQCLWKISVL